VSAHAPKARAPVAAPPELTGVLRRKCSACESSRDESADEESEGVVRRAPDASAPQHDVTGVPVDRGLLASPGQPLGNDVRALLEPGFGRSLADVRVRADAAAARAADALHARAFTIGSSIWFGAGEYRPDTGDGQRLLAHEVAHTVQQSGAPGASGASGTSGASGSSGAPAAAQAKLTVGRADDPAERAADVAADTVLRGERSALPTGGAMMVRRQPKGGAPDCTATAIDARTATVKCGDREFRVTATPVTERRPATRISATPDIDATDISLDVSICRGGTEVRIKPSVNLPAALRTAIGNAISSGSIGNVTVKPRASITWLQSRQFDVSLTGGPDVDVGTGRVSGGTIGGAVDTGDVKFGGNVILGPDGKPIGGGITIGSSTKPKAVDCHDEHVVLQLSCESVKRTPGTPAVPPTAPQPVDEQLEIFFEYMSTKIREGESPSQGRLDELSAQGAHVVSIDGFASPEGPRQRGPGFIGNNRLSADRATTAEGWLRRHAPQLIPPSYSTRSTVGQGEIGPPDVGGREPQVPAQDVTYPSLRKATIHLTRTAPGTPGKPATDPTVKTDAVDCPDDVKRAARKVLRRP
jgi:hypothetical protein